MSSKKQGMASHSLYGASHIVVVIIWSYYGKIRAIFMHIHAISLS